MNNKGFAALFLVISLSVSLMTAMVASGDSLWRLKASVVQLGDRTQSQLGAEACQQLAMMYISEDPEYKDSVSFNFEDIDCSIISVSRTSTPSERIIESEGRFENMEARLVSVVEVTNHGVIEKSKIFK